MSKALESPEDVVLALSRVGDLLADEGQTVAIAIIGGAALLLSGLVKRATQDVDVLALRDPGPRGELRRPPDPLPEPLLKAVRTVQRDQHLVPDWLNAEAGRQWITGIPEGLFARLTWMQFGGLQVGIASRTDLIALKIYAATGATGAGDKHYQDLLALKPDRDELAAAAGWARTQGSGPEFSRELKAILDHAKRDLDQGGR